jgi:hypothetical protein
MTSKVLFCREIHDDTTDLLTAYIHIRSEKLVIWGFSGAV